MSIHYRFNTAASLLLSLPLLLFSGWVVTDALRKQHREDREAFMSRGRLTEQRLVQQAHSANLLLTFAEQTWRSSGEIQAPIMEMPSGGLLLQLDMKGNRLDTKASAIRRGVDFAWWEHRSELPPAHTQIRFSGEGSKVHYIRPVVLAGSDTAGYLVFEADLSFVSETPLRRKDPDPNLFAACNGSVRPDPRDAELPAALIADLADPGSEPPGWGWRSGNRYAVWDAGLPESFQPPPRLIAIRTETRIPGGLLFADLIVLGLGAAFYLGSFALLHWFLLERMLGPLRERISAGDWALRIARDQRARNRSFRQGLLEIQTRQQPDRVEKELKGWYAGLRQVFISEAHEKSQEVHKDLDLAREFQMAYLNRPYPKVPERHVEGRLRLGFHHHYQPASALGGDFFDVVKLANDCAGVVIADVMGHGTRSALVTSMLRTLIGDLTTQGRNAQHFMTEMNRQFCDMIAGVPSPQFASAFYLVADTTSRMATYTTAGHPAPFHLRRSVGRISRLESPQPRGAALGLVPGEDYTGGYFRLVSGDVFLFFTDGIFEAANAEGEEFGAAEMEQVLRRVMYKPLDQLIDGLIEELNHFVAEETIADDICVVAMEVTTDPLPPDPSA